MSSDNTGSDATDDARDYGYFAPTSSSMLEGAIRECREMRDGVGVALSLSEEERRKRFLLYFGFVLEDTGQDFGEDIEAYAAWFEEHRHDWKNYSLPYEGETSFRI